MVDAERRVGGGEREREAGAIAASDRTRVYFECVAAWELGGGCFLNRVVFIMSLNEEDLLVQI